MNSRGEETQASLPRPFSGIIESKSSRLEYLAGKSGRYGTLKRILPQSMTEEDYEDAGN